MTSKAGIIAKKIKQNQDVILYSAGTEALTILKELEDQWGLKPACVCDKDPKKWYHLLSNIEIIPPDEAITRFPDAYYFIASRQYKYQIIGTLLSSKNISPDKILNYEQVEKRVSYIHLESSLVCIGHKLNFCCSDFGKKMSPFIEFNGEYDSAIRSFIFYRDNLILR